MVNIIGAMVFIILSLFMITSSDLQIKNVQNTQNRVSYIQQEAKELTQYSNAVFNYITAYGSPGSPSGLLVPNLISAGLLPSNFPTTTPFGQSFTVNYNVDTVNPNVEDVIIRTTGNLNSDLTARANLNGTLGYAYLANEVGSQINIPQYPNSTGTYIGIVNSNLFSGDGQDINLGSSVPASSNAEPAIYIKAPDQYGYWLINFSAFMQASMGGLYAALYGMSGSLGTNLDRSTLSITSLGFYLNCPSYDTVLSSSVVVNSSLMQTVWHPFPYLTMQQSTTYCIPAYRDQVVLFNSVIPNQYFDYNSNIGTPGVILSGNPGNNYNNGFGFYPDPNQASYDFINSDISFNEYSILGYEHPTYGIENAINDGATPIPDLSTFMPWMPNYSFVGDGGFQLDLTNSSGKPVVYQFAAAMYSVITGPGICDATLTNEYDAYYYGSSYSSNPSYTANPCDTSINPYPQVYYNATDYSNQNLDSIGNTAFGWVININPSNPNSYTFGNDSDVGTSASTFPYYEDWYNGNYYSIPLTVDTSTVYN